MGKTFVIHDINDMCAAMCDNYVPDEQWYIFTFGSGQEHAGMYVKIWGTYKRARTEMRKRYGNKWAFQYTEEQWKEWLRSKPEWIPTETELEKIVC